MSEENLNDKIKKLNIDSNKKYLRSGKSSRRIYWIIGTVMVLLFLYFISSLFIPIEVETVKVVQIKPPKIGENILTASGYVIPKNRIELSPKIIGRVIWIGISKGDKVKKNQPLVRLEDTEYLAQVNEAKARLNTTRANLNKLRTGSRKQDIQVALSTVNENKSRLGYQKANYERISQLYSEGAVSKDNLDNASTQYQVALSQLDSAKENFSLVVQGPRIEDIQGAESEVKAAQATLDYALEQYHNTVITAPVDGTILERLIEVGEIVTNTNFGGTRGARSALLSIADLRNIQVEIDLNESDLHKLRLHQPATIKVEAIPDISYKGEIVEISPEANRQKATVQIKIQILNPDNKIKPEMSANVSFINDISPSNSQIKNTMYLPSKAILKEGNKNYVFIIDQNKAKKIAITIGIETENGIECLSGLDGTESVILKDLSKIKDGIRIKTKS